MVLQSNYCPLSPLYCKKLITDRQQNSSRKHSLLSRINRITYFRACFMYHGRPQGNGGNDALLQESQYLTNFYLLFAFVNVKRIYLKEQRSTVIETCRSVLTLLSCSTVLIAPSAISECLIFLDDNIEESLLY